METVLRPAALYFCNTSVHKSGTYARRSVSRVRSYRRDLFIYWKTERVEFATVHKDTLTVHDEAIFIPGHSFGVAVVIAFNWARVWMLARRGHSVACGELGSQYE